jgi:hypothetical protein
MNDVHSNGERFCSLSTARCYPYPRPGNLKVERRKPKRVNAMIALPEDSLRGNVEVAK